MITRTLEVLRDPLNGRGELWRVRRRVGEAARGVEGDGPSHVLLDEEVHLVEEQQHKKDGHADHENNSNEAHQSIVGQQQVMQKFHRVSNHQNPMIE